MQRKFPLLLSALLRRPPFPFPEEVTAKVLAIVVSSGPFVQCLLEQEARRGSTAPPLPCGPLLLLLVFVSYTMATNHVWVTPNFTYAHTEILKQICHHGSSILLISCECTMPVPPPAHHHHRAVLNWPALSSCVCICLFFKFSISGKSTLTIRIAKRVKNEDTHTHTKNSAGFPPRSPQAKLLGARLQIHTKKQQQQQQQG